MDKSLMVKTVLSFIGGCFGWFWGGWDIALKVLIAFVLIDFVSGVMSAWFRGEVSSKIAFRAIPKKIMIFLIVGIGSILDNLLNANDSLRVATIFLYIGMEGISILENAIEVGLPVPDAIMKALKLLKPNNVSVKFESIIGNEGTINVDVEIPEIKLHKRRSTDIISIHAPLAGSDSIENKMCKECEDFNPRSPCGKRP